MPQDLDRVYTIPLGKVLLSPDNHRAKRAINMIRDFARRHMKIDDVRIDEEVAKAVWSRGMRRPPRRIRVHMTRADEGYIQIHMYGRQDAAVTDMPEDVGAAESTPAGDAPGQDEGRGIAAATAPLGHVIKLPALGSGAEGAEPAAKGRGADPTEPADSRDAATEAAGTADEPGAVSGEKGAASGEGPDAGQGAASGEGPDAGQGAASGEGPDAGQGAASGEGPDAGQGAASGEGPDAGQGAASGEGPDAGQGAASGEGPDAGQGADSASAVDEADKPGDSAAADASDKG